MNKLITNNLKIIKTSLFAVLLLVVLVFSFGLLVQDANAQTINIWEGTGVGGAPCNKPIVDNEGRIYTNACDFCDALIVVRNIIQYLVQAAIAIAVGMIVWGAIQLMIAGGSEERVSKGKKTVTSAVIGIAIVLSSWVIINTIIHILAGNPTLKIWDKIKCERVTVPASLQSPSSAPSSQSSPTPPSSQSPQSSIPSSPCPLADLSPITDPEALTIENNQQRLIWLAQDRNVQNNLNKLKEEFEKLQRIYPTVRATSAYRPQKYQEHLYEIYLRSKELENNPTWANNQNCSQIIAKLRNEQINHSICNPNVPPNRRSCLVSSPHRCAPHTRGTGIDIVGIPNPPGYLGINRELLRNGIDLEWAAYPYDPVHFELKNPPWRCR